MTAAAYVFLALTAFAQQDPRIPPEEEAFKGTPQGYVIQSKYDITTYQAVTAYFRSLTHTMQKSYAPDRVLALTAARLGVSPDSEAWQCFLDANQQINQLADRRIPAEVQLSLRHDPAAFRQTQRSFQRRQVLDMRAVFVQFKADYQRAGGDVEALMDHIREWAADHVTLFSDVPKEDPSIQELLAIERLFDAGEDPPKGEQK